MALIYCRECGKEISDKAEKCPHCGFPLQAKPPVKIKKEKGFWSAGRLTIGIISMVLFFLISLQSCAVGLGNAITENGSTSGTSGALLALMMLIAGIVGVCTRNSKSKGGAITSTIFYLFGAVSSMGPQDTYGDLPIWGIVSFCFGIVFLISAIKTQKER